MTEVVKYFITAHITSFQFSCLNFQMTLDSQGAAN